MFVNFFITKRSSDNFLVSSIFFQQLIQTTHHIAYPYLVPRQRCVPHEKASTTKVTKKYSVGRRNKINDGRRKKKKKKEKEKRKKIKNDIWTKISKREIIFFFKYECDILIWVNCDTFPCFQGNRNFCCYFNCMSVILFYFVVFWPRCQVMFYRETCFVFVVVF